MGGRGKRWFSYTVEFRRTLKCQQFRVWLSFSKLLCCFQIPPPHPRLKSPGRVDETLSPLHRPPWVSPEGSTKNWSAEEAQSPLHRPTWSVPEESSRSGWSPEETPPPLVRSPHSPWSSDDAPAPRLRSSLKKYNSGGTTPPDSDDSSYVSVSRVRFSPITALMNDSSTDENKRKYDFWKKVPCRLWCRSDTLSHLPCCNISFFIFLVLVRSKCLS